jgi:vacuolar-type H+-ATPase subunit H
LSKDIEELIKIIEQEKIAENKINEAHKNAEETIKRAKEEAKKIMNTAESSPSTTETQKLRHKDFEEEKRQIEKKHERKIDALNELARKNFDQTVKIIIEEVMKV